MFVTYLSVFPPCNKTVLYIHLFDLVFIYLYKINNFWVINDNYCTNCQYCQSCSYRSRYAKYSISQKQLFIDETHNYKLNGIHIKTERYQWKTAEQCYSGTVSSKSKWLIWIAASSSFSIQLDLTLFLGLRNKSNWNHSSETKNTKSFHASALIRPIKFDYKHYF